MYSKAFDTFNVLNKKNLLKLGLHSKKYSTDVTNTIKPRVIFAKQELDTDDIRVGSVYHGFKCEDIQKVPEFNLTAYRLVHEKTRTEYLHINRPDPNNVFSINFRTTPFDSTGLPHILEHTVLCGSKKYPVRDPFFNMLNRSISNFMNAMTGPDFTFYPFSTVNEVDYRNLQAIYMDAVFHPNLSHLDFLQEGWRLEQKNLDDKKSDYSIKGVVYNEMKGVFADNSAIFSQTFLNTILPDHTYRYVSGGHPLQIPKLTHTDLVNFHHKYYHPSNAKIYSYGNFSLTKSLAFVDDYVSKFDPVDASYSIIPNQKRWTSPQSHHVTCRYDNMGAPFEKQNQIAIGYLMSDITNIYETFLLQFITELMIVGPNSYFYKSLIEPNISGGYNGTTGYESQLRDTMFVIGLQNIAKEDFDKFDKIYNETIDEVIAKGFDANHIKSVLHRIELNIKHQSTKFGLNLLFGLVPLWNHNGNIMMSLQMNNLVKSLKENLKDPTYLQKRVENYFKNNNHKLTLTMTPDTDYEKKLIEAEHELLLSKVNVLSEEDKNRIYEENKQLEVLQKTKANVDMLPCLKLNDIPLEVKRSDIKVKEIRGVPFNICHAATNGIVYFRSILSASHLNHSETMLLPLFNSMLTKFGTQNHDFRSFDQLVNMKTSGLSVSTHLSENLNDFNKYELGLILSSFCLNDNSKDMMYLWNEIFDGPLFNDESRLTMLLENYLSNLSVGIAQSGHLYAIMCSSGLLQESSALKESLSGLQHIDFMKKYVANNKPSEILQTFKEMATKLLTRDRMRCSLNIDFKNDSQIFEHAKCFLENTRCTEDKNMSHVWNSSKVSSEPLVKCKHNVLNIPVNFCAKSISAVPYTDPDYPKLQVLAKFLSSKYLHHIVREQNGAYGSGLKVSADGIMNFYSYRDPNSRKTLDVFDESGDWFKKNANLLDDQVLFEAKLGVLQTIDAPIAEGLKGYDLFAHGVTQEIFQNHRSSILRVTKDDMMDVCVKYFTLGNRQSTKTILGPKSELEKHEDEIWVVVEQEGN
ncbi:presequence protease, mitochondrial-like [Ctenocephalides felis]|uniref:presequence protease, mitochondrial-like n=1 Tax=Ctenocephalides felis TaxID=7515 RepID=UPI000E6E44DA|nr:presequence protease, mitochondrial-like [Ctenocephalides felis]